jgi:hypothetical protein
MYFSRKNLRGNRDLSGQTITLIMWKGGPPYPSKIVGTVADPNPDKPELKIEE